MAQAEDARFRPILNKPLYKISQLLARMVMACFRTRAHGMENVPANGPVLIVSNHQSFLDPPLVGYRLKRYLTFLARASLFTSPGVGGYLRRLNTIPLKDEQGDVRAIRAVIDRISRGEAVVIFPEGARTFDGAPVQFRDGVSLIVRRAKCPVLPVAIEGAFDAWPRQEALPGILKGHRIQVEYGQVIPYDQFDPKQSIADRVQAEVESLRLRARDRLRERTKGARPVNELGDQRFTPAP